MRWSLEGIGGRVGIRNPPFAHEHFVDIVGSECVPHGLIPSGKIGSGIFWCVLIAIAAINITIIDLEVVLARQSGEQS